MNHWRYKMNISVPVFLNKIQSIHPELTEQDLFVKGKELSVKGFAMLLAHFDCSMIRTGKPFYKMEEATTASIRLFAEYLQTLNYVSMFFIIDGNVYLTGQIKEVAFLSNRTFQSFIAELHMFDNFEVYIIDGVSSARKMFDKLLYVVPSIKPYVSTSLGMAKRKARQYNSYVITVNPDEFEPVEKTDYDKKLTTCCSLLSACIGAKLREDAPNGLYAEFKFTEKSKSLLVKQQRELVETLFDEVLVGKIPKYKVIVHMRMDYFHNDYDVIVQYNKKGKTILKENIDETYRRIK